MNRTSSLLLPLLVLIVAARATHAESALDHVVPRLDRDRFGVLLAQLGLEGEQRLITELAFADYCASMANLVEEIDAAAESAGRRRLDDALAGRVRLDPAQLRSIQVEVLRAYRGAWPRCDAMLSSMLESIAVLVPHEQRPRVEHVFMNLRRSLWLEPRAARRPLPEYAGEAVDVTQLVEAARREDGELSRLEPDRLADLLEAYAVQMDALLQQDAAVERTSSIDRRIARAQGDVATMRRLERGAVERWRRFYQLNEQTVAAIERRVASDLGPEPADRWRRRWRNESFPWLRRDERADRLIGWMNEQALDAETRRRALEIEQHYRVRRAAIDDAIVDAVLEGRLALGRLVHPASTAAELDGPGGAELHERLLKLSGERQTLLDTTAAHLEALLTPAQRRKAP